MHIRVRSARHGTADLGVVELLSYLRGAVNKRGELQEELALYCRTPLCKVKDGEGEQGVRWTFSTFDLDRFEERVDPEGWDLARYRENPVVQWSHAYDIPAIGRAEDVGSDERGLGGRIVFNDKDYDPFGWSIGERVRRGIIRAGSVGFRVLEVEFPGKDAGDDGTTLIFRKQELLEFSICNVPANPFALAGGKSRADGGNDQNLPFWGQLIQGRIAG